MTRWSPPVFVALALAGLSAACEPDVDLGRWKCSTSTGRPELTDGGATPVTDAIAAPWSTGFENGFCDYAAAHGYCYSNTQATYDIVTSPVHSGKRAAGFHVTADSTVDGRQARCVLEGALPPTAYYGAWFWVSAFAQNTDNWNLMHFEKGDPATPTKLWDLSIGNGPNEKLYLYVYDFSRPGQLPTNGMVAVPVAAWFHVEFYWRRAADGTGEVTIYQDDAPVLDLPNLSVDASAWARWYVGDLVDALDPPDSTVFVDDVSIRSP